MNLHLRELAPSPAARHDILQITQSNWSAGLGLAQLNLRDPVVPPQQVLGPLGKGTETHCWTVPHRSMVMGPLRTRQSWTTPE